MSNTSQKLVTESIAAIVVLYFPDKTKLTRLLNSVQQEVDFIILVDNTENDSTVEDVNHFVAGCSKIAYVNLGGNFGIAAAQNKGIHLAKKSECTHIVFFDQDSSPQIGMVTKLLVEEKKLLSVNLKIGLVGPSYIDEKTSINSKPIQFFAGFMLHSISNKIHSTNIQVDFIISKEIRNFYKIRNLCYLISHKPWHWRFMVSMSYKIPIYLLVYTIVSRNKLSSLSFYLKACINGFSGNLGKFNY